MTGFYPESDKHEDTETFKPRYVFVKFNDGKVGKRNRLQSTIILIDNVSTANWISG